jgi:DNA-directed RNA polymerase specialized sigma24 family protein
MGCEEFEILLADYIDSGTAPPEFLSHMEFCAACARLTEDAQSAVAFMETEYREIGQVLGIPEGTVKSRLSRGRAELARLLNKHRAAYRATYK